MWRRFCIFTAFLALISTQSVASPGNRVTILYDAFAEPSALTKDWGYAALVEYRGRRILFDTGNDAEVFAHNVAAAGVDLGHLDFAVISHRHLDHTAGLSYLLAVNPGLQIYVPLDKTTEIAPGIFILALVSEVAGTRELRELSLAIDSPEGLILMVGCSHPGIEKILEAAPDEQISRVGTALYEGFKVERLAAGHCTGEPAFASFRKMWGRNYVYAGLGSVIELP